MRLIDADALRDEWLYKAGKFEPNDVLDSIDDAPTIDPAKWIPCKERLPEKEYEVLVTTSWHDVCIAWYDDGKWRAEYINEYDDDEILAWRPKPEPMGGKER